MAIKIEVMAGSGSSCSLVCVSVGALGLGEGIEVDSLGWGVRVSSALE